jgi:hypothetical protein
VRRLFLTYRVELIDWLDQRGITTRRIKHNLRFLGKLAGACALLTAGFALAIYVLVLLSRMFNWWVQTQIIDPKEFFTLWVAEFPIIISTAVILRIILKEPRAAAPEILIEDFREHKDGLRATIYSLVVSNEGETAARLCRARIMLSDLEQKDIIDVGGTNARVNPENFMSVIKTDINWGHRRELTIRSGDDAEIEILRLMHDPDGKPQRFEIPSENGWSPICVALRPSVYYFTVRVVPLNGRPTKAGIETKCYEGRWIPGFY